MSTTKTLTRSTKTPSSSSIERRWYIIDAQNKILGRLSTKAAGLLIGKGKSNYVANLDLGDHVIIINAKKIVVTGSKEGKKYYHHSGYPGGLKETDLATLRKTYPDRIITSAIRGMLPKNRLLSSRLKKLHVYEGSEHPYEKINPTEVEFD